VKKNTPARKRAETIYERFVGRKREFAVADVKAAMRKELRGFSGEFYEAFIEQLFETIDRGREIAATEQQTLLFDLGGVYRLEGRRIAKRFAQLQHAEEALAIDTANMKSIARANQHKREELERLRPYWGGGRTKAEAVTAYLAEHPPGGNAT
jgi:hypothetical protein